MYPGFLSISISYYHLTSSLLPLVEFLDIMYPAVQESIYALIIINMHVVSCSSINGKLF